MPRKYQVAWDILKKNPSQPLVLVAHPSVHKRVYKAIKKEKTSDDVWNLEQDDHSTLRSHSDGTKLTITLHFHLRLSMKDVCK